MGFDLLSVSFYRGEVMPQVRAVRFLGSPCYTAQKLEIALSLKIQAF